MILQAPPSPLPLPPPAPLIDTAWRVETIPIPPQLLPEIGAIDFAADGRLWVGSRRGVIWRVDLEAGSWEVFAEGLHEITGLADGDRAGEVFACDRPSLVRVRDLDGDFVADEYESLSEAWGLSGNYHEYTFGPVRAPDGSFFVGLGCASDIAGIFEITRGPVSKAGRVGRMYSPVPYRGWVLRIAPDGTMTPYAKGFREPNGMALGPAGDLFVTDNQGDWLGTSALHRVEEGRFYGHPISLVWDPQFRGDPLATPVAELDRLRERPIVLFPHNRCCNSPTQPVFFPADGSFGPFAGQMIVGDIPSPRLLRVALEKLDGRWQGAVFPFLERGGLRSGNNRLVFAADGRSLVIGQGSRGWAEGEGLQRVVFSGRTPMEIAAMRAAPGGFELEFTLPLDRATLADPARCSLERYHYEYHRPYGSPEIGLAVIPIRAIRPSPDPRRVLLELDELRPGEIHELHLPTNPPVRSTTGLPLAHTVAWYTVP